MPYRDKVCVITGASSGIGRSLAKDLAARGAVVIGAARRGELLASLVDEIGGTSARHSYVVTDVSRRDDVARLAGHVRGRYGRCDVLVNNAGFSLRGPFNGTESIGALEAVMATNFYGAVYCTAEFLPLLEAAAPSSVVNVASMAGRLAVAGASSYCASKFALVGWSEALSYELATKRICVSLVEPGPVPTEGFPQSDLGGRFLRHTVTGTQQVSRAVMSVIEHRRPQRVVPRWYYLLLFPRLVIPPLYRRVHKRVVSARARRPPR